MSNNGREREDISCSSERKIHPKDKLPQKKQLAVQPERTAAAAFHKAHKAHGRLSTGHREESFKTVRAVAVRITEWRVQTDSGERRRERERELAWKIQKSECWPLSAHDGAIWRKR